MEVNVELAFAIDRRRLFVEYIFELMEKDLIDFKTLLDKMVGIPDFLNRNGQSPLQIAAGKGDSELVCRLLERGSDSSYAGGAERNSPLHVAAAVGDYIVCEILLQYWAPPYVRNHAGKSPAQLANANGHFKCAILINHFLHDEYIVSVILQKTSDPRLMLPPDYYGAFNEMVKDPNLNPINIALNSRTFVRRACFPAFHNALKLLRDTEIEGNQARNMPMLLKLHYICCVVEKFLDLEANAKLRVQLRVRNGPELFLRLLSSMNRYMRNKFISRVVTEAAESFPFPNAFRQKLLNSLANKVHVCSVTVLAAIVSECEAAQPYVRRCGFCCGPVVSVLCEKCGVAIWCNEDCKGYDEERHSYDC